MAVECKYQDSQGTVDEKIPYALDDIESMWLRGCVVYAGQGFSKGVVHMLEASPYAARCFPDPTSLKPSADTRELDHIIANVFGWWEIILAGKRPFDLANWTPPGADPLAVFDDPS